MLKIIFLLSSLTAILLANQADDQATLNKIIKLSNKGEKIAKALCNTAKLPPATGSIEQLIEEIKTSNACPNLLGSKLEAVAYYVSNGTMEMHEKHLAVPNGAKCPVCGMFVSKYPKWAASITHGGEIYYFDGVKDMMKYYIFDGDFIYDRKNITQMMVSDYYTLEAILAREAFYIHDSNIFGPMGRELIPFKSQKSAESFMADHGGKGPIKFDEITQKILMHLDGMEIE